MKVSNLHDGLQRKDVIFNATDSNNNAYYTIKIILGAVIYYYEIVG